MKLQNRIELLLKLRNYLLENSTEWQDIKHKASIHNGWFTPEFIDLAVTNIAEHFLEKDKLNEWVNHYFLNDTIAAKEIQFCTSGSHSIILSTRCFNKTSSLEDVLMVCLCPLTNTDKKS